MDVYFDTSTWNHLEDHDEREKLIHLIQQRKQRVVASVISVVEILRIRDDLRRQKNLFHDAYVARRCPPPGAPV